MKKSSLYLAFLIPFILSGCSSSSKSSSTTTAADTNDETGQQVGDAMASIDESGGSNGQIALQNSIEKTFRRLSPNDLDGKKSWSDFLIQPAYAASCHSLDTFGTCDAGTDTITRTFGGCTLGLATFEGTVLLTWASAGPQDCHIHALNDTITRDPDFTATGLRGATLTVKKTGTVGQQLKVTATLPKTFEFTNDGIQRTFTKNGETLFDFTTETTSPITVTGANRSNRVLSGGTLRVTNNKTDVTCDYSPTDVTWNTSTCNCPVSGTWDGTCSDGKTTKVEITGCGTADLTIGTDTKSIEFDRCEEH